jgi:hypothetical protein
MLQSIPTEIDSARLKTTSAIEQLQAETIRFARDERCELTRLSEEHTRSAQRAISDQFHALTGTWKDELRGAFGQLRSEFSRDVEACKDSWTLALSLHRQEMSGLLSARPVCVHSACSRTSMDPGPSPNALPRTREEEQTSLNTTSSTSHLVERTDVDAVRAGSDIVLLGSEREACGRPSSISAAGLVDVDTRPGLPARILGFEHTAGESAGAQEIVLPDAELEIESQLSALPKEDSQEGKYSQDAYESQDHNVPTTSGRPFGALNQHDRSRSANRDFTTPDSPPFSIHRQRFELSKGTSIWTRIHRTLTNQVQVQFLVHLLVRARQRHRDK